MDVLTPEDGWILLTGAGVVLVLGIVKRERIIAWIKAVWNASSPPILSIELIPEPSPKWRESGRIWRSSEYFRSRGFEDLGTFRIPQLQNLTMRCFFHPSRRIYASVSRHPLAGVSEEVCFEYEDLSGVTVSNCKMGGSIDNAPGQVKIFDPSLDLESLVERAEGLDSGKPKRVMTADNIKQLIEDSYRREMEWRERRGGITLEEVQREAANASLFDSKATVAKAFRSLKEVERKDVIQRALDQWNLEQGLSLRDLDEMEHRPIVVPSYLSLLELLHVLTEHTNLTNEQVALIEALAESEQPAALAFAKCYREIFEPDELRLVGSVDNPISADLYAVGPDTSTN